MPRKGDVRIEVTDPNKRKFEDRMKSKLRSLAKTKRQGARRKALHDLKEDIRSWVAAFKLCDDIKEIRAYWLERVHEPPDTQTVTMPRTAQQRVTVSAGASREGNFAPLSKDSGLAAEIKAMIVSGDRDAARERFADLVALQQRRASRIAYHCLRDVHDADEAVQDAFVKVFTHLTSYREDLPFEVWFTRILVNGCLDLRKARARRLRWVLPASPSTEVATREPVEPQPNPEDRLLATECGRQIAAAVAQLPERQRAVFTLCQIGGQSAAEVSQALGLSEPTVRVHLFRAIRKLRGLLERERTR